MVSNIASSGLRRRAVNPDQKAERRDRLLAAGRRLFSERALEDIGVAQLASEAGVAKGTFYLYFDTKEALFLALVRQELAAWFEQVDAALSDPRTAEGVDAVVVHIESALRARPMLPRLLAVLHSVLERNIDYATARDFKLWLQERSVRTGAALEAALPFLEAGGGLLLILRMHALVIGFQHAANPAPVVRQAIDAEPDLAVFDMDFLEGFGATLRVLLAGWSGASDQP